MKAITCRDVLEFQDIPNVGKAMERDFRQLGLTTPSDLKNKNPLKLYQKMCLISGSRQDPCVLDTYMAVIDFMNGSPARIWWTYTKERKHKYPKL